MYSKDSFLASLKSEAKIVKHLATCVPAGQLDYRPTPAQRSTLEVLQYLTYAQRASTEYLVSSSWDAYDALAASAKEVTLATFAKAIDKQHAAIVKLLRTSTDATLKRKIVKHWSGAKMTFGEALIEIVLKPFTAYRMQLFLYAKASGASTIGSSDCWRGVTDKPKEAKAATT